MQKIKLTKINELPNAYHQNNIPEGEWRIGIMENEPKVNELFWITSVSMINGRSVPKDHWFRTSTVTEVVDPFTFKTLNSIYKIEYLKDDLSINDLTD